MKRFFLYSHCVLFIFSSPLFAQAERAEAHVVHAQLKINEGIKGTLDGVIAVQPPIMQRDNINFPRAIKFGMSMNPWSTNKRNTIMPSRQPVRSRPKGNPWAPIGQLPLPNAPMNRQIIEKNPYTDNDGLQGYSAANNAYGRNQFAGNRGQLSEPFSGYNNAYNNGYYQDNNPALSTPFGDSFWPGNQFWPSSNGGSSFPFMPW